MSSKKISVIHVGTGPTGKEVLRSALQHPELELVGHYVNTPEKIGKDSGELVKLPRANVIAKNNWDELLALKADCLMYAGNGVGREHELVEEVVPFLSAGTNVVTMSLIPMVYPPTAPPEMREPLAEACAKGGGSFFNSGIDPGFATTQLPIALLSISGRVRSVRMQEISCYGEYPVVPVMRDIFGFGRPLDYQRPIFGGVVLNWWRGTVAAVADALKVRLDEIRPVYEVTAHDSDIETLFGPVPAGTTAGIRFQVEGVVNDKPVVVLEHVSRAHVDVAPHWPGIRQSTEEVLNHQYNVIIEGDPSFVCQLDSSDGVALLKWPANHLVNAIPSVCAAKPGVIGPIDLPPFVTASV